MADVASLQARQDIAETMSRYCRSLDRMDRGLMATVFHPAATVRYPEYAGSWMGFVDWMWDLQRAFDSHSHRMANILIDFRDGGRSAVSESYVSASAWKATAAGSDDGAARAGELANGTLTEVRARYLDQWSLEEGDQWRMRRRTCVVDIRTELSAAGLVGEGRRDRDDPSYRADFDALLDRQGEEALT